MREFSCRFVFLNYYKWRLKPSNACRFFLCLFVTEIGTGLATLCPKYGVAFYR